MTSDVPDEVSVSTRLCVLMLGLARVVSVEGLLSLFAIVVVEVAVVF